MSLAGVVGGAVGGLGAGLLLRSKQERENTLLTRKENREDLVTAREDAIADARQLRQQEFQLKSKQLDADRENRYHADTLALQRDELSQRATQSDRADKTARELAGNQGTLQREHWDREDRRQVEESAGTQLAALDKRIQTVQDAMLKGEYLGKEAEAKAELDEAKTQQRQIRYRSIRQLAEQGDPRYKDMGARDIALAAGFSREQVLEVMRSTQPSGGGPVDASDVAGAPPGPAQTPAAAPMNAAPPPSPAPLADLTKKGRGNKAPDLFKDGRGSALPTVTGRSGVQVTDVDALFTSHKGAPKQYGGGRGAPVATKAKEPPRSDDTPDPKNVLTVLRAEGDLEAVPNIDKVRQMSASTLRKAGFTDQEILKLLRPSRR